MVGQARQSPCRRPEPHRDTRRGNRRRRSDASARPPRAASSGEPSPVRAPACPGRQRRAGPRAAALGRADGGPAGRRQARQIALQTLQRGSAAGRHAGAVRLIVATARLPDRVCLRLARLLRARRPRQGPADQPRKQCQPNQGCSGRAVMMSFPSLSRPCAQCRRDGAIGKRLPSSRASVNINN